MTYQLSAFLLCAFLLTVSGNGHLIPNVGKYCKWQMTLKTGDLSYADTRANISMVIHVDIDPCKRTHLVPLQRDFEIKDLKQYGTNSDPNHAYFGSENQDTFEFEGPCWDACRVSIYSDGTGGGPGWFLAYATKTISSNVPGVPVLQKNATVNTWLSVSDPPYILNMTVDFCRQTVTAAPGNA